MFARRLVLSSPGRAFSTHFRSPLIRRRRAAVGAALIVSLLALYLPSLHADDLASFNHPRFHPEFQHDAHSTSIATLVRAYAVYSMCSVPFLVDHAPDILSVLRSIPGSKQLTDALVRATFFSQFVGGDTAQQAIPLLHRLRAENKGVLFAYSVESDASVISGKTSHSSDNVDRPHKRIIEEIIRCIDVAADFEDRYRTMAMGSPNLRKTWVAVKMTALVPDASTLSTLSAHILRTRARDITFPGLPTMHDLDILHQPEHRIVIPNAVQVRSLTQSDLRSLKELHADLVRVCTHAAQRGVKIIIDAEHSWYQPAIDALTYSLMRQFNKLPENLDHGRRQTVQPLVYTTCQAYLRRTPDYLTQAILDAKANGYALGVKLVRGAYHPHEIAAHNSASDSKEKGASQPRGLSPSISPDTHPPVWPTKDATDACFNESTKILIRAVRDDIQDKRGSPTIGVLFGTHNRDSCNLILDELVTCGLASRVVANGGSDDAVHLGDAVTERVTLAQLYGMSDALTEYLVGKTRSISPFVIKYVPYGALSEVIPYLSRRAIENKSVLGQGAASEERQRAWAAIRKRLFG